MRECFLEAHKARVRSDLELSVRLSVEFLFVWFRYHKLLSQLELVGRYAL